MQDNEFNGEWYAGSGRNLALRLSKSQAMSMYHPGPCDADMEANLPDLRDQVAAWEPAVLAAELREYGAWDDEQLADHEANIERMVWIAAGDLCEAFFNQEDRS